MLEEAIDVLFRLREGDDEYITSTMLAKAIQLGIEALERQTKLFNMISKGEAIENIIQLICEPLPSEDEKSV